MNGQDSTWSREVIEGMGRFWCAWTTALLGEETAQDASKAFDALAQRSMVPGERRSALCPDGTHFELSLAMDSLGSVAARFVCDAISPGAQGTELVREFRECADIVVPASWQHARILDLLADDHLRESPNSIRFRVWHGAGFGAGGYRLAKFYFNCEWLGVEKVQAILAKFVTAQDIGAVFGSPLMETVCGVGYDLGCDGIQKVKAYARIGDFGDGAIEQDARRFCHHKGSAIPEMVASIRSLGRGLLARNCIVSLGLRNPMNSQRGREFKCYFPFSSTDDGTLRDAAPLLNDLVCRWGLRLDEFLGARSNSAFAPTLLSFGVDDRREIVSLYFKPRLRH